MLGGSCHRYHCYSKEPGFFNLVLFYVIYRAKFGTGPSESQKIPQPVIVPSNVMVFDFLSF
jgi:hypothetical protein